MLMTDDWGMVYFFMVLAAWTTMAVHGIRQNGTWDGIKSWDTQSNWRMSLSLQKHELRLEIVLQCFACRLSLVYHENDFPIFESGWTMLNLTWNCASNALPSFLGGVLSCKMRLFFGIKQYTSLTPRAIVYAFFVQSLYSFLTIFP